MGITPRLGGRYRVAFDGRWQERFEEEADAVEWAQEVAETGRTVYVAQRRWSGLKLVAVFPEIEIEPGRWLWRFRDAATLMTPEGARAVAQERTAPSTRDRERRLGLDARDWEARGECPACGGGIVWTDGRCSHCAAAL